MKHLTRIAALIVAATVFALPLSAQSHGRNNGGSNNHGSSHGSGVTSSHSRSGSSSSHHVSSGSSGGTRRSGSAVSSSSSSSSRPSSGSSVSNSRPSGGSSKPSGGSISSGRPDGGKPSVSNGNGNHRPGGNGGSVRRPGDNAYRHSGGSGSATVGGSHRPPVVNRPPFSGNNGSVRPRDGHPGRVQVNPRPGNHPHRPPHREFVGKPARFNHHGPHGYGYYVTTRPIHYEIRHYHGIDYYFWNDIWYRYSFGRYWVCRPPFGYAFTPLADAVLAACSFAYYYDVISEGERTIAEQNATIAANNAVIAEQNSEIAANARKVSESSSLAESLGLSQSFAKAGTEYYYNDGVFYIKGDDGQYIVIVPPAGALVDALPGDYELIELGGNTYYKVDDTVYRMTISEEGKACFEVLGQLNV